MASTFSFVERSLSVSSILKMNCPPRFLVKARRDVALQAELRDWLGRVRLASGVRLAVDIDPYSFL